MGRIDDDAQPLPGSVVNKLDRLVQGRRQRICHVDVEPHLQRQADRLRATGSSVHDDHGIGPHRTQCLRQIVVAGKRVPVIVVDRLTADADTFIHECHRLKRGSVVKVLISSAARWRTPRKTQRTTTRLSRFGKDP